MQVLTVNECAHPTHGAFLEQFLPAASDSMVALLGRGPSALVHVVLSVADTAIHILLDVHGERFAG